MSDTWNFWQVITDYVPRLKEDILAREGRVIIRPDSGVPEDIICGVDPTKYTKEEYEALPEHIRKGAYECLWDVFGGRVNSKGYKVLDSNIGMIYGDSITLERQKTIYARLEAKGFAATNLVLGVGSYTYQYKSRDSLGFAMKATWCQVNGEGREIFKDPKTDDGVKKSLKGLIKVNLVDGKYVATDQVTKEEEEIDTQLETVFINGELVVRHSLEEIRKRVDESLS